MRRLTNADIGQAIYDYKHGRSVADIAAGLQVTTTTVYTHLKARNVTLGAYKHRTTKAMKPKPKKDLHEQIPMPPLPAVTSSDWAEHGLCRQTDPEEFFPAQSNANAAAGAKKVCGPCPVRAQCLEWAMTNDERYGVWGGLTPRERNALSKRTA